MHADAKIGENNTEDQRQSGALESTKKVEEGEVLGYQEVSNYIEKPLLHCWITVRNSCYDKYVNAPRAHGGESCSIFLHR